MSEKKKEPTEACVTISLNKSPSFLQLTVVALLLAAHARSLTWTYVHARKHTVHLFILYFAFKWRRNSARVGHCVALVNLIAVTGYCNVHCQLEHCLNIPNKHPLHTCIGTHFISRGASVDTCAGGYG